MTDPLLEQTLDHLRTLVASDTQNPPRDIQGDQPIFRYLADALGSDFQVSVTDHGQGRVSFFAVRGAPGLLFNVHLDTVPVGDGWRVDPLALTLEGDRAYGRGVCDIKGAAAVLLTIAANSDVPLALLFTTDEEGAQGVCVQRFIDSGQAADYEQVIVAEPTRCRAISRHAGYLSVIGTFRGTAGHSSEPAALAQNAIHRGVRWADEALDRAQQRMADDDPCRFNLGTISGGTASNVIAAEARLHWSARLAPGADDAGFLQEFLHLADAEAHCHWNVRFNGPPLPRAGGDDQRATAFAESRELPLGEPVAFWTEASLFGAAGIPALVLGPGDIRQAHTVDEWVALAQLEQAYAQYHALVQADG